MSMSILHRILVSKHKHKRPFVKRKVVYKKFMGLKTFKNVLSTKFSPMAGWLVYKKPIIKKAPKKVRTQVVFPRFNHLTPKEKRHEAVSAKIDVANFRSLKLAPAEEQLVEEKFQAFLPQSVWQKMTSEERRTHINKRKLLAMKRDNKLSTAPTYSFSNKKSRLGLKRMSFARRKYYLKNLIKAADRDDIQPAPFSIQSSSKLALYAVKSALQVAIKARASRRIHKTLTYASLVPARTNKLTF